MSKLGRKARIKDKKIEESGKKAFLYLIIGLVIVALIIGIIVAQ